MKKTSPARKLQDHICPQTYKAKRRSVPREEGLYARSSLLKKRCRISYIPGETPPEPVDDPPRLFIRGLVGGCIDVDLRGLGIRLSAGAFGHWVADESLSVFDIRRGDIAIIDPAHRFLQEGNLVLLESWCGGVLRRLKKRGRLWYLETGDGSKQNHVALTTQPLNGVVVGTFRLFTRVKALRYGAAPLKLGTPVKTLDRTPRVARDPWVSMGVPIKPSISRLSSKPSGIALIAEKIPAYPAAPRVKKAASPVEKTPAAGGAARLRSRPL